VSQARHPLGDALQIQHAVRRHGRMGARRLKALEEENARSWNLRAKAMLDLGVVYDVPRECLTRVDDTSLAGTRVTRERGGVMARQGRPMTIVSDNHTVTVGGPRPHPAQPAAPAVSDACAGATGAGREGTADATPATARHPGLTPPARPSSS
jgi:hypothetical protein